MNFIILVIYVFDNKKKYKLYVVQMTLMLITDQMSLQNPFDENHIIAAYNQEIFLINMKRNKIRSH